MYKVLHTLHGSAKLNWACRLCALKSLLLCLQQQRKHKRGRFVASLLWNLWVQNLTTNATFNYLHVSGNVSKTLTFFQCFQFVFNVDKLATVCGTLLKIEVKLKFQSQLKLAFSMRNFVEYKYGGNVRFDLDSLCKWETVYKTKQI